MRFTSLLLALGLGLQMGCTDCHSDDHAKTAAGQDNRYHPMTDESGQYHSADTGQYTTTAESKHPQQ